MTAHFFGNIFVKAFNKEFDFNGDAPMCALTTSSYTVSQAHDYFNDITNEVSSTNYTAGGFILTTPVFPFDGTSVFKLDSDDPSWTTVSFTTRYGIYWVNTGGASSTDPLVSYLDFGGDQTVSSANFTITQNAAGIATVTIS